MNYDNNNIFARIIRGELPCIKVYEDADTLAFMDIMPQMPGHLLVLPKAPAVTLYQLPDDALLSCMQTIKKVGKALQTAMAVEGSTLVQHNGSYAGQSVPHVHFHIIPGPLKGLKPHAEISGDKTEIEAIAARIRDCLAE
ncbi:HIT domain-containing protein [Shewanella yunxiaonensis]|uniref:HIT domain-containing protein n=1 Tax=Shewanella yunxiaonensis TaxID=2829809 RepID=A0ABX7YXY9_9GAMM|nr:HIT domain-containing protein [Shewanella yunxiaonensis]